MEYLLKRWTPLSRRKFICEFGLKNRNTTSRRYGISIKRWTPHRKWSPSEKHSFLTMKNETLPNVRKHSEGLIKY